MAENQTASLHRYIGYTPAENGDVDDALALFIFISIFDCGDDD